MRLARFSLVSVLALAGCGSTVHRMPTAGVDSAGALSVAVAPSIAPVAVPAGVAKKFGQADAEGAYDQMASLTAAIAFQPDLVGRRDGFTAADFSQGREQMTTSARASWDADVAKALGGDTKAAGTVRMLMFYDLDPAVVFPADDSLVLNQSISAPRLSVDGPRLKVDLTQNTDVTCTLNGVPKIYRVTKTISYRLVPAPAGTAVQWLIDGWGGTYTAKTV